MSILVTFIAARTSALSLIFRTGERWTRWREFAAAALLLAFPAAGALAQAPELPIRPEVSVAALPDAPRPMPAAEASDGQISSAAQSVAESLQKPVFKLGPWRDPKSLDLAMPVVPLSAGDKLKLSFQEQLTPFAFASMAFAAGWEQLRDSNPKYGSDSSAFGLRLGAAALRQTSQAVFSDGVYAAVFHEDPRFYRLASGSVGRRIYYAASRTLRTRTDSGAPTFNYSLIFGHATAQALTLAYYPDRSQHGGVAVTGFFWSLLGNMLGNQYHEFWPDILEAILQRPPAGPKPTKSKALPAE